MPTTPLGATQLFIHTAHINNRFCHVLLKIHNVDRNLNVRDCSRKNITVRVYDLFLSVAKKLSPNVPILTYSMKILPHK